MAMAMYEDNTMEMVTSDVTWASSNPSVATVSNSPATAGLVTAISAGSAQISVSLDGMEASAPITVTVPSTPPPLVTVMTVHAVRAKRDQVAQITVGFSGPVDAPQAEDLAMYRLVLPGTRGRFQNRTAKVVKLRSAVYDASKNTVVLALRKPLTLTRPIQLTIDGEAPSGLADSQGRLIDGNGDGSAGGDATVLISPKMARPGGPRSVAARG
jgi:hypothetical protein